MSFIIHVIAELIGNNPPSILFIIAFLTLIYGLFFNVNVAGWVILFLAIGVVLQVLWLIFRQRFRLQFI
jgi:hypothetical protein